MRQIWSSPVRIIAFWGLTIGATLALYALMVALPLSQAAAILIEAGSGSIERLGTRDFAFALAGFIVALAGGLALGFGLLHAVMISISLGRARAIVARQLVAGGGPGFALARPGLRRDLGRHPLIGDAWRAFDDTLTEPEFADEPLRYPMRARTILNAGIVRDRLTGLKMMPSIPSYFVGVGLLLTFFGLVLALNEAAIGTTSTEIGAMRLATARLLQVATFKFATSIAGLGASIVLSILFRAYAIAIEAAFERFCRTAESELQFAAPETATLTMNHALLAQLAELRLLNSPAFGERLSAAVAPALQMAMLEALQPLTERLAETLAHLDNQNRTGIEDLLQRFLEGVRGGAGAELRGLGDSLKTLQTALDRTHQSLSGSGHEFASRMAETADNLNRLMSEAGGAINASAQTSTATLQQMVAAMEMMFERANGKIEQDLAGAAGGASARLEAAMGTVMARLEAQITQLQAGLGGFEASMSEQLTVSRQRGLEAQEASIAIIGRSAAAAAGVMETGFSGVIAAINAEVDRMVQSMQVAEIAMVAQAGSIKDATTQSKAVADAFGRTADLVRTASAPLVQSSDRIAGASDRMAETIGRSVAALEESQRAAKRLAETLTGHIERLSTAWTSYEARFGQVDEDLGLALTRLSEETRRQLDILATHTVAIDQGLALAVDKLSGHVAGIAEGAGDLAESVEILRTTLLQRAAE